MNHDMNLLIDGCSLMGIEIDNKKVSQFQRYLSLLLEWNEKFNLTAITDPKEVIIQHFLDAISILELDFMKDGLAILDMGTGAGFPGVPIKIMLPKTKLILVDSVNKKTVFLKELVKELNLDMVEIIHARAEDLGREPTRRETYDVVVSRAVAELKVLLEYCLPFVRVNGCFVSYKGPGATDEVDNSKKAIKLLGGKEAVIEQVSVPYSDRTHMLVITKKVLKTPKEYPRKAGKPKKLPLA